MSKEKIRRRRATLAARVTMKTAFYRYSFRNAVIIVSAIVIVMANYALSFQIHRTRRILNCSLFGHSNSNDEIIEPKKHSKRRKESNEIRFELERQLKGLSEMSFQENLNNEHDVILDESKFLDFESNMYYAIWASRSVTEVQSLLMQFIDVFKTASVSSDAPKETQAPNEFQIVGPNIAAAALMRITDIRFNFHREKGDDNNMEVDLAKAMTPSLLQVVAEEITQSHDKRGIYGKHGHDRYTISYANKYIQRFTKSSTSFFNLGMTDVSYANVLYTLAKIQIQRKKGGKNFDDMKLTYLVQIICSNICNTGSGDGDELQCSFPQKVNPILLTKTLCSLATFDMNDKVQLLSMIGDRLIQGDAIGKLNGRYLSLAMWAYASLERPHVGVLKSFSRRLRKSSVRGEMLPVDITRAVWAVGHSVRQLDLATQQNEAHLNSPFCPYEDVGALREDVAIMVYTLAGELLKPKTSNHSEVKKINGLNTNQVIDLLGSFIVFEFEGSHPFVIELTNHIKYDILQRDECSATHIAKMLWSFQRLRFPIDNDVVQSTVDKFVDIILSEGVHACAPSTLNQMLRSITLILPDHGRSYPQLYLAASYLLNNRNYLKNCNEFECSNFLWCYAMAKYYDKEVILSLSERMRNDDIISSLTPSSVSRYLWSFTSLVESYEEDIRMKETLFEMFETLGGILLSAQLKPVDSSKAMWAMAKSSYALNIGIFDHLAEVLSNDSILERASVQQISQALWSCGKMVSWEDPLREKLEFGTVSIPPYVKSAEKFASFLVSLHERMSAKDISQIIWSLGRLKIMNTSIVYPIANKAAQMAQEECFNSQELANILWGLSKVEFNEPRAVSYFTAQLRRSSIMNAMTPQEASNVLYALAKMCIKDEHTFNAMNQVLMRQPEHATTQTIANALWAHETIGLIPPKQLFNSWAKEKLHIVGLYVENQQIEIIERSSDDK